MEGRARPGSRATRWSWVLPMVGASLVRDLGGALTGLVCIALGLFAGAAWQRLYRRDLVDRLTGPAVLVVALSVATYLAGDSMELDVVHPEHAMVYAASVLIGLVLCEQVLRMRDTRAHDSAGKNSHLGGQELTSRGITE